MKRILVPTDFSECAQYALMLACDIASKNNSKLLVLHTVEYPLSPTIDPTGASVFQSFDAETMELLTKKGKANMKILVEHLPIPQNSITQLVEVGSPSQSAVEKIREYDIDLVVMGSHGARGAREFVIGSNAQKVVRRASCPVITLKKEIKLDHIKKVAFASDFVKLDESAMAQLKQMQHVLDAEIDFVRVNTPNNFERDAITKRHMDRLIKREMFLKSSLHIYNDLSEEEGLIHFAEERGSDMLGMITHGRTGLDRLFSGSVAEDVVNHVQLPVWTMKINE